MATTAALTIQYSLYIIGGALALGTNAILIIAILKVRKALLAKYALIFSLAISDAITGLSFFGMGIYRLNLLLSGTISELITRRECIINMFAMLLVFQNHLMGTHTVSIGIERFIAVGYPIWFKNHWHAKVKNQLIVLQYIYCIAATLAGALVGWFGKPNDLLKPICNAGVVTGPEYSLYFLSSGVVCGIISLGFHLVALFIGRRRLGGAGNEANAKLQLTLTKLMLSVAVLTFVMVVIPRWFMLMLNGFKVKSFAVLRPYFGYITILSCLNSSVNLFLYVGVLREIRGCVLGFLTCTKAAGNSGSVGPVGSMNASQRAKDLRSGKTNQSEASGRGMVHVA